MVMSMAAGAVSAVANALLHTKGKLIKIGMGGSSGGGMMDKLGAAAASMSPVAIPGLAKDPPNEVSFTFNPTDYKLSRSVGLNNEQNVAWVGGIPEFLGTGPLTLTMELLFDEFHLANGDVTPKVDKLFAWQLPDDSGSPPLVMVDWGANGTLKGFKGVIKDVSASYTLFNKSGTPIQATVDITIEETVIKPVIKPGTNPTSHATDARRIHVVVEGDTLASIAYAEYGEPGYWRAIAQVNGIDDPLRVRPGANLLMPSAADAAELA
jgi:hypothetical protein